MTKLAQDQLKVISGGEEYFDEIDRIVKLPKNLDIVQDVFDQIRKEQGNDFNLILTGGFGDWILSLIKKGKLKVPGNVVSTNGSIRGKNGKLGKTTKGKEVDIIHKRGEIDDQKFVLFDDSYYSGSTKKALEDYLKRYNSEIYKTYVLYSGGKPEEVTAPYHYYQYHTGTESDVNFLLNYLYNKKVDVPKDGIEEKILKGVLKTENDVDAEIKRISRLFGVKESRIITKFDDFGSELKFYVRETVQL